MDLPSRYFNEAQRAAALYGIARHVHAILSDEIWRLVEAVRSGEIDAYLYDILYQSGADAGVNQPYYRYLYNSLQALMGISVPPVHDEAGDIIRAHFIEGLARQVTPICQRNLLEHVDSAVHRIGQRFGMGEPAHGSARFRLEVGAIPDPQGGFDEGTIGVDCSRVDALTLPGKLYEEHERYSVLALLLLMSLCRQLGRDGISLEHEHGAFVHLQPGDAPHALLHADLDMDALIQRLALAQDMQIETWLDNQLQEAVAASVHCTNAFGIPDWLERIDRGDCIASSSIIGMAAQTQADIAVTDRTG
ncbi:hypothetical protein GC177_08115 [bacterium]|nr:hypothetical protein [bacterium]